MSDADLIDFIRSWLREQIAKREEAITERNKNLWEGGWRQLWEKVFENDRDRAFMADAEVLCALMDCKIKK